MCEAAPRDPPDGPLHSKGAAGGCGRAASIRSTTLSAQSGTALTAILLGFTAVPAALMAVAVLFQRRCRLDAPDRPQAPESLDAPDARA